MRIKAKIVEIEILSYLFHVSCFELLLFLSLYIFSVRICPIVWSLSVKSAQLYSLFLRGSILTVGHILNFLLLSFSSIAFFRVWIEINITDQSSSSSEVN